MLKVSNSSTAEGLVAPTDCEKYFSLRWLSSSVTGNFYVGDHDKDKSKMQNFINGKKKCYIDSPSYFKYLDDVRDIAKKFEHLFKGPISVLDECKIYFEGKPEAERYIYISYEYPDRYLKTSKKDKNVEQFKSALLPNITKLKIVKSKGDNYRIYVSLDENWRQLLMKKSSKCTALDVGKLFDGFAEDYLKKGWELADIARLFGIKYKTLINYYSPEKVLEASKHANDGLLNFLKDGMKLSKEVIWEENKQKNSGINVFGIRMPLENTALDSGNPHVCLGWGDMGDLSDCKTKEDLKKRYSEKYPESSADEANAVADQIILFKDTMQIGDYIVYFDKTVFHFGKVIGDYEYIPNVQGQNVAYTNSRKVTWICDVSYEALPDECKEYLNDQKCFFLVENYEPIVESALNERECESNDESKVKAVFDYRSSPHKDGRNLIIYGTPGCGKSHYVENVLLAGYSMENRIRTIFFSDYTNADFVGQILPDVQGDKVTYSFIPGPFTLALERAIENPSQKVALVIEELNRGNAPSIFGEIFQLLDRGKDGVSEYSIINVHAINYLNKRFKNFAFNEIRIPGNLSIFATMNTCDQNVFTLDTAFKRRWEFKKLFNTFKDGPDFKDKFVPGANLTWKNMVESINDYILTSGDFLNTEDKQLGVYFVDGAGMRDYAEQASSPEDTERFAYKVLEYLWDDVSKFNREKWFDSEIKSLDQLVKEYIEKGIKVFSGELKKKFEEHQ